MCQIQVNPFELCCLKVEYLSNGPRDLVNTQILIKVFLVYLLEVPPFAPEVVSIKYFQCTMYTVLQTISTSDKPVYNTSYLSESNGFVALSYRRWLPKFQSDVMQSETLKLQAYVSAKY
jgi:hypothetical protein